MLNLILEDITIDFIDGLPQSGGYNFIFVVVDRLSKYAHFISLKHPYTAVTVVAAFAKEVIRMGSCARLSPIVTRYFLAIFGLNYFIYSLPPSNRWSIRSGESLLGNLFAMLFI